MVAAGNEREEQVETRVIPVTIDGCKHKGRVLPELDLSRFTDDHISDGFCHGQRHLLKGSSLGNLMDAAFRRPVSYWRYFNRLSIFFGSFVPNLYSERP